MTQDLIYSACGIGLFGLGLYGLLIVAPMLRAPMLRKILSLNVMGIGIFVLLIATAHNPGTLPDPVPHAMVLTGIVVAVAGTALALFLVGKISELQQDYCKQSQNGSNREADQ